MHVQRLYTCINGERATDGPELSELVELCLAYTLYMNLHCQLVVMMNPEIADSGLGCNSMVAETNVIDADLRNLLSTAQPDKLCFPRIQLQPA